MVDNASKDGTLEYITTLDWVRIITNEENLYAAKAACQGLETFKNSDSAYVMLLDSDVLVMKQGWLTEMVNHVDSNEQIGAIGPKYGSLFYNQDIYPRGAKRVKEYLLAPQWLENLIGHNETSAEELLSILTLNPPHPSNRGPSFNELCGWCQLYKRDVIDKIGRPAWEVFPQQFWDSEFSMRVLPLGYRLENSPVVNSPEAKVHHFGQRSSLFYRDVQQYARQIEKDKEFIQSVLTRDV